MRTRIELLTLLTMAALAPISTAPAELQNVELGGEVHIRGRYWRNAVDPNFTERLFSRTPIQRRAFGPFGLASPYDADDQGNNLSYLEQRTTVNVRADFTDNVSAFIELESFEKWGKNFRSNYLTGADAMSDGGDSVEVHQSYIEINQAFDWPLRLRIGRQEILLGKGWLVSDRVSPTMALSFDAIRATYANGPLTIDAWWSKLAENSSAEEDGDVDFLGLYATYAVAEPLSVSAYWMAVRDARSVEQTDLGLGGEWVEGLLDLDRYDTTMLHTFGVRVFGNHGALDYDLELAYQTGEADAVGALYTSLPYGYGDNDATFDAWAADLELGYTFDTRWSPRVFAGGAYFQGEDNRDVDFFESLKPFSRPEASVSFNRLFSSVCYSGTLDILCGSQSLSNFYQLRAGVSVRPTESVTAGLVLSYLGVVETFDWPLHMKQGRDRIALLPALASITQEADDDLGVTAHLWAKYNYSDDLWFKVGWEHLFTGDGVQDGNYVLKNGHELLAGTDDDDLDYVYFQTQLKF